MAKQMICKKEICNNAKSGDIIMKGSFTRIVSELGCKNKEIIIKGVTNCYECICCDGTKVKVKIACTPSKCIAYAVPMYDIKSYLVVAALAFLNVATNLPKMFASREPTNILSNIDVNALRHIADISNMNIEDLKEWLLKCVVH